MEAAIVVLGRPGIRTGEMESNRSITNESRRGNTFFKGESVIYWFDGGAGLAKTKSEIDLAIIFEIKIVTRTNHT